MLQVRPFDIEIGQHKVMLNVVDARERGLNAGDRVRVRTKGAATTAILDTTLEMVKVGEIGIFTEALKDLKNPNRSGCSACTQARVSLLHKKDDGQTEAE